MNKEDLAEHLSEIEIYGYTVLKGGNPNWQEQLSLIREIDAKEQIGNKQLDHARSRDGIVYNLQNKHKNFIDLLMLEDVKSILKYFLNDDYYQVQDSALPNFILNYYNARSSGQFLDLHIDSSVPAHGEFPWAMQAAFVLEDMDEENGCTVVVPGSHQSGKYTNRDLRKRFPIVASAGDIAIWDSRIWHGTLDNISGRSRWVLIATFTRWWLKQSMDMTRSLPDSIYKKLTDEQKLLLGFCSIPPSDESNSIHTKKSYLDLKNSVTDYYN